MLQLVKGVATAAPIVYQGAEKLAKKISGGKSLSQLVTGTNGPALVGELLVKSGMPLPQLKALMEGYGVTDARDVLEHAAQFVQYEVKAVSDAAVKLDADMEGLSPSVRDDILARQIHETIKSLGLRDAAELMKVATVLRTVTIDQIKMYRDKGTINPKLGYA